MRMSVMLKFCALAAIALLAVSAASAASGRVTLSQDTNVNGTKLTAGDYKVSYDENGSDVKVTFKQGKKEFTAPAKLEQTNTQPSDAMVGVSTQNGSRELRSLQLAGKKAALTFGPAAGTGASSSSAQ
jgi:opacity protein-like surface antigen